MNSSQEDRGKKVIENCRAPYQNREILNISATQKQSSIQYSMVRETTHTSPDLWQDFINPPLEIVDEVVARHGFHQLDRAAVLEENQYARIDTYDDYMFMVLHFPKWETATDHYINNELNIFISREYILTFRYYESRTMRHVRTRYEELRHDGGIVTPEVVLYEILDAFLDKTMVALERVGQDIKNIERDLFGHRSTSTIHSIMVKKRNTITLKHMMQPQISVLRQIRSHMQAWFGESMDPYFARLEDKLDKIHSECLILQENIESQEDTLKSVFELETNSTIKRLTVFSAFLLPVTLATSFFGMNVEQGHFDNMLIFSTIVIVSIIFAILAYFFIKKRVI